METDFNPGQFDWRGVRPQLRENDPPEALLNDRQSVAQSKFFKNPMHRSGLALGGAQTTVEAWQREEVPPVENDGILTLKM